MRLIVTRPAQQAAAWVQVLQTQGLQVEALPLIGIESVADPAPVCAAWESLAQLDLVMFVSANAVAHFFARRPPVGQPGHAWPVALRAACTGPGTAAALLEAGLAAPSIVSPPREAGLFDSEALWRRLAGEDWRGRRVLIVRGESGRDWFADTLRQQGAEVRFVTAYVRAAPGLDATASTLLDDARARPRDHLWLFSSSEAIAHLQRLCPQADWQPALALTSHPRIAEAAKAAGFGWVRRLPDNPVALAQAVQSSQAPGQARSAAVAQEPMAHAVLDRFDPWPADHADATGPGRDSG